MPFVFKRSPQTLTKPRKKSISFLLVRKKRVFSLRRKKGKTPHKRSQNQFSRRFTEVIFISDQRGCHLLDPYRLESEGRLKGALIYCPIWSFIANRNCLRGEPFVTGLARCSLPYCFSHLPLFLALLLKHTIDFTK